MRSRIHPIAFVVALFVVAAMVGAVAFAGGFPPTTVITTAPMSVTGVGVGVFPPTAITTNPMSVTGK
jgi:multidrug efflux pump subunit AcrB